MLVMPSMDYVPNLVEHRINLRMHQDSPKKPPRVWATAL
jgi:hypothetical protein